MSSLPRGCNSGSEGAPPARVLRSRRTRGVLCCRPSPEARMTQSATVPARAWVVTAAGTAVNLCLGILYAWSVWSASLVPKDKSRYGQPMTGLNEGWTYLTVAEGTVAYSICGFTFALCMIPGGRIQGRHGPRVGVILGGLCLAAGCVLAGLMRSYTGLVIGFGVLGGVGMG